MLSDIFAVQRTSDLSEIGRVLSDIFALKKRSDRWEISRMLSDILQCKGRVIDRRLVGCYLIFCVATEK